jgi:hypothetical protein
MNHPISQTNVTSIARAAFGYLVLFGISVYRFFKPSFLLFANPFIDVSEDKRQ